MKSRKKSINVVDLILWLAIFTAVILPIVVYWRANRWLDDVHAVDRIPNQGAMVVAGFIILSSWVVAAIMLSASIWGLLQRRSRGGEKKDITDY